MQEISLNILDIAQNSIKANAKLVQISIAEDSKAQTMSVEITDDGAGMTEEQVKMVVNPFYTTRTTRKVGLGVPFFKMTAEMTGGSFHISSEPDKGTTVLAKYNTGHIDMLPLGDMASTMTSLISVNDQIDFVYRYTRDAKSFTIDTRAYRAVLGDVPLHQPEVLRFIQDDINENQQNAMN